MERLLAIVNLYNVRPNLIRAWRKPFF